MVALLAVKLSVPSCATNFCNSSVNAYALSIRSRRIIRRGVNFCVNLCRRYADAEIRLTVREVIAAETVSKIIPAINGDIQICNVHHKFRHRKNPPNIIKYCFQSMLFSLQSLWPFPIKEARHFQSVCLLNVCPHKIYNCQGNFESLRLLLASMFYPLQGG